MFNGFCAFPLTPFNNERVDFTAFGKLISNLTEAKVEGICAMGSTGLYPYLSELERKQVAERTVQLADGIPTMVGIGALRTDDVLRHADHAQQAGVNALLLAPVSYHALTEEEVFGLYEKVTANVSVPLCVYENPGVTQFRFSESLYQAVTQLPHVAAIKIPGMPFATEEGEQWLASLKKVVPDSISVGVSGDKFGVAGLLAGCDTWHSVFAGLFPNTVRKLVELVRTHNSQQALARMQALDEMWDCFARNKGGLRVMAAAAEILGYTEGNCLPHPLMPLNNNEREFLKKYLMYLQLGPADLCGAAVMRPVC